MRFERFGDEFFCALPRSLARAFRRAIDFFLHVGGSVGPLLTVLSCGVCAYRCIAIRRAVAGTWFLYGFHFLVFVAIFPVTSSPASALSAVQLA